MSNILIDILFVNVEHILSVVMLAFFDENMQKISPSTRVLRCFNTFFPFFVSSCGSVASPQSHRRNLQTQGQSTLRFQPIAKK
jgi:hypothetical protein